MIDEKDEDADLDKMVQEIKKKGAKVIGEDSEIEESKSKKKEIIQNMDTSINGFDDSDSVSDNDDTDSDSDSDSDYDVNEHHVPVNNIKKDGFEIVKAGTGIQIMC